MNPPSQSSQPSRPRLLPDEPLPPYTFIPGQSPHPISDPAGHSYGYRPEVPEPPDPQRWRESLTYLRGLDLFNHGYYWEAHEAWESLWMACGRTGETADFLKALIKLAAAGVKHLEEKPQGTRSHAERAAKLLRQLAASHPRFLGLDLGDLLRAAGQTAGGESPPILTPAD
jgi:uncharacterized protein